MRKVYVAGKWGDRVAIRSYIDRVKSVAHVTYDWTRSNESSEGSKTTEEMRVYASLDAEGVKAADQLIVVITDPDYEYRGTCTEMGIAIGLDKPIVMVCPFEKAQCQTNVFYWHKNIQHVKSFEECLEILVDHK